ncbi:unnamed protein product [Polarella glacialis]|uniref:Protochlorophyllide reductase n=1 Tax=Polarella glacialis TaxID=89957 RepID=A0A813LFB5_POLGL|nr:unnamed protein product [Polarella glacialis]CAE8732449.1 unnamed protein product [Polarella glacialis]
MNLDTSSLQSVRRFAHAVKSQTDSLDMLVLNAGSPASGMPFELSEDGIEKVFATNYLGHFLLHKLLLPLMERGGTSGVARVVAVTSRGHADSYPWGVAVSREQLNDRSSWQAGFSGAYPQSKLAQIYFVQEAARRMGQKPVYVNAADPGGVHTAAWDGIPDTVIAKIVGAVSKLLGDGDFLFSPEDGALPQLYLAAAGKDLAAKNIRGRYFTQPVQELQPCLAGNLTLQEALWDFSEKLVET